MRSAGAAGDFVALFGAGDVEEAGEGRVLGFGVEGVAALAGDLADEGEDGDDAGLCGPEGEVDDVGVEEVGDVGECALVVAEPGGEAGCAEGGEEGLRIWDFGLRIWGSENGERGRRNAERGSGDCGLGSSRRLCETLDCGLVGAREGGTRGRWGGDAGGVVGHGCGPLHTRARAILDSRGTRVIHMGESGCSVGKSRCGK